MIETLRKCNALLRELKLRHFVVDFPEEGNYADAYRKVSQTVNIAGKKVRIFFERDLMHLTYVVFQPPEETPSTENLEISTEQVTYVVRANPLRGTREHPDTQIGELPIDEQFLSNMHYELLQKYKKKVREQILDELVEARLKETDFV